MTKEIDRKKQVKLASISPKMRWNVFRLLTMEPGVKLAPQQGGAARRLDRFIDALSLGSIFAARDAEENKLRMLNADATNDPMPAAMLFSAENADLLLELTAGGGYSPDIAIELRPLIKFADDMVKKRDVVESSAAPFDEKADALRWKPKRLPVVAAEDDEEEPAEAAAPNGVNTETPPPAPEATATA